MISPMRIKASGYFALSNYVASFKLLITKVSDPCCFKSLSPH